MSDSPTSTPTSPEPVDSATLLIVDATAGGPRVLMGRRRSDDVFMADKFVFPGGRVDPVDADAPSANELQQRELELLLIEMAGAPSPARARAIAMAAIRETFEEAGIAVGRSAGPGLATAGHGPGWAAFRATGLLPALAPLRLVARAVTPPGRPYRYDSRFFCVPSSAIAHHTAAIDGELSSLDWFTIEQIRRLDLPNITRTVIEELWLRLAPDGTPADAPVPYFQGISGNARRRTIGPQT